MDYLKKGNETQEGMKENEIVKEKKGRIKMDVKAK
jgi:hypothetical protein